ncbi:MAG TPA: TonB-dependent receptor, partial [Chitinophagaceae bacterium]
MNRIYAWMFFLLSVPLFSMAQSYNRGNGNAKGNGGMQMPRIGHLFGRIMDASTNKPVEFAAVSLLKEKDSTVVNGMLTQGNGDFSLENVPFGQFILRINFIGYNSRYKNVTVTPQKPEQDLGNFKLSASTHGLKEAVVTANKSTFTMGIDKKVFNVEKSLASVGGTATDVLRQVPTVNVDIDGNVTLRNGSPTIFVDGKKSLLTLDQIPADQIQSIEIITNPSAKYDASGMSGIINIVLKKDRKPGINGNIMAGAGTHDKYNAGGMLNIYQKPVNITLNYFLNSRNMPGSSTSSRDNLYQQSYLNQDGTTFDKHLFQVGRLGIDYYLDNRNTLSLSGGMGGGNFNGLSSMNTTYLNSGKGTDSSSIRGTSTANQFRFISSDLNYTHNFIKEKEQLTAEASYRSYSGPGSGIYNTQFYGADGQPSNQPILQNYATGGKAGYTTLQTDYTNPLNSGKAKLEAGLKAEFGNNNSYNNTN